jgi:hypothetical protein
MNGDWFVRVMGETLGPMQSSDLQNLADRRRLSAVDEVRRGHSGDWTPAATVPGLKFPAAGESLSHLPSAPPSTRSRSGVIWAIAACVLIVLVVIGMVVGPSGESRARDVDRVARAAVLDQITTPSTAEFISSTPSRIDGRWIVNGEVDYQNRFGAKERHRFVVAVNESADGKLTPADVSIRLR